jgi:hypothetical protein
MTFREICVATVSVCNYRFCILKPIGRTKGKSAVGSAAYISRTKLKDEESGKTYDYRKGHSEPLLSKIYTPNDAPDWVQNRGELWNNVQKRENRKNSQFARSIQINLPHELSIDDMKSLLDDYVKENFTDNGMVADVALHAPDKGSDSRNFHAHILLTLRRLDTSGFTGNKVREWNKKELFNEWRKALASKCSQQLEKSGHYRAAERWQFGYLTLDGQRKEAINRGDLDYANACKKLPSIHKGMQIHHMEKRGVVSLVEQKREQERLSRGKISQEFLNNFRHLLPDNTKVGNFISDEQRKLIQDSNRYVNDLIKNRHLDRERHRILER